MRKKARREAEGEYVAEEGVVLTHLVLPSPPCCPPRRPVLVSASPSGSIRRPHLLQVTAAQQPDDGRQREREQEAGEAQRGDEQPPVRPAGAGPAGQPGDGGLPGLAVRAVRR